MVDILCPEMRLNARAQVRIPPLLLEKAQAQHENQVDADYLDFRGETMPGNYAVVYGIFIAYTTRHTIVANGMTYDFHILPSGLLNPRCTNLVGSGCVVHVPGLLKELADLEAKDLPNARERLYISDRCQ